MIAKQFGIVSLLMLASIGLNAARADTVRLAIGEWAPFTSQKDPDGKLAEKLVSAAFNETGYDVEYAYFPWKRSYQYVEDGQFDGTFPWYATDERRELFILSSEAVIHDREVFFHRTDLDFDWTELSDLEDYRIGGTIGYYHVTRMRDAGLEVTTVATDVFNFRKLHAGRIDLFPASYIVGVDLINKLFTPEQAAELTSHPKPLTEDNMYMLFSRNTAHGEQMAEAFNTGLKRLKESGRYDEILGQYLPQ